MLISLKSGATVYPLAGTSGVSERVHSSASDFRLQAQALKQTLQRVRAASAPTVDRGNLTTTVSFGTTRVFASADAAFLYILDYDRLTPREGVVEFTVTGGTRNLLDAVVDPPVRRCIGCTAFLDYTATGSEIVIP